MVGRRRLRHPLTLSAAPLWIDSWHDTATPQVDHSDGLIRDGAALAITDIILTELLQGAPTDNPAMRLERSLGALDVLRLLDLDDYRRAASLSRSARKAGHTIRRTSDCLIASVCVREDVAILHADSDFDRLAQSTTLRVLSVET